MYRCAGRRGRWLSCKTGTGSGMPAGRSGRPGRRVIKIMKENAEHLNNEQENRTGI
ncbi:conserved domain protein [Prevotella denticola CRIS 18C-A]|uniref:Conserved domain protein n=1 Tax=Prevotella denticola CRIS 18C-A TaxID=944557 RepID=F0H4E4_9BACT|nr:conserved domain protein [Prevotella denticola CRIS 18C-A]